MSSAPYQNPLVPFIEDPNELRADNLRLAQLFAVRMSDVQAWRDDGCILRCHAITTRGTRCTRPLNGSRGICTPNVWVSAELNGEKYCLSRCTYHMRRAAREAS